MLFFLYVYKNTHTYIHICIIIYPKWSSSKHHGLLIKELLIKVVSAWRIQYMKMPVKIPFPAGTCCFISTNNGPLTQGNTIDRIPWFTMQTSKKLRPKKKSETRLREQIFPWFPGSTQKIQKRNTETTEDVGRFFGWLHQRPGLVRWVLRTAGPRALHRQLRASCGSNPGPQSHKNQLPKWSEIHGKYVSQSNFLVIDS